MITELIFVYNADSGAVNAIFDIAHKIVSPKTYNCTLCSLTHGAISENKQWRQFKDNSQTNMTFLHKDEFESKFDEKYEYPVVLTNSNNALVVLLSASEISSFSDVGDLIKDLESKIS